MRPGKGDTRLAYKNERFRLAVDAAKQGKLENALRYLGQGLHALQDVYSHMWLGPAEHVYNPWVDWKLLQPSQYKKAHKATEDYLRSFLAAIS
jgi:hypothetical protein